MPEMHSYDGNLKWSRIRLLRLSRQLCIMHSVTGIADD